MPVNEFLRYLLQNSDSESDSNRLPPLKNLSEELGISVSQLREQVEVAKVLGLVDVRPRLGIRQLPYSFTPAINASLSFAITQTPAHFEEFLDLRRQLEQSYLPQARATLTEEDFFELERLIASAWEKLRGRPVRIPHQEHRSFHLTIFHRLDNVFVKGLLEAYWDAYEAVGLNVYADLAYLERVWSYHEQLTQALRQGKINLSIKLLKEHFDLLVERLASA